MHQNKGFVAFHNTAFISLTDEERESGMDIPEFEFEGDIIGGFTIAAGSVMKGHANVSLAHSPGAELFPTREEAERFIENTPNPSRWIIIERVG